MKAIVTDLGTRDFESWLVAREPSLRRLAHLLASDPHTAADLVQATLAKMYLAWPRLAERDGGSGSTPTPAGSCSTSTSRGGAAPSAATRR